MVIFYKQTIFYKPKPSSFMGCNRIDDYFTECFSLVFSFVFDVTLDDFKLLIDSLFALFYYFVDFPTMLVLLSPLEVYVQDLLKNNLPRMDVTLLYMPEVYG